MKTNLVADPLQVVISHYDARPTKDLVALLDALAHIPAGCPYRIRVVVNRTTNESLRLPVEHEKEVEICYRENAGYNIGGWEQGWHCSPEAGIFLFLQDECLPVRENWGEGFRSKAKDSEIGLVGERINPRWDRSWGELENCYGNIVAPGHTIHGRPADRISCYRHFFSEQQIDPGPRGDHLQTLVLCARREVLEAIDGFPLGVNKGEAIAAEIGISKKVQSLDLEICEAGPQPFWYFRHSGWS